MKKKSSKQVDPQFFFNYKKKSKKHFINSSKLCWSCRRNRLGYGSMQVYPVVGNGVGLVWLCIVECGWSFVVVEWIVAGLVVDCNELVLEHELVLVRHELERQRNDCLCSARSLDRCTVDRIDHHRSYRLQSWIVVVDDGVVAVVVAGHGIGVEHVVVVLGLLEDDHQMLGICNQFIQH